MVNLEERHILIKKLVYKLIKKHIAGSTSASVLNVVRGLNNKGIHTTVTLLNDHVDDLGKARYNTNAYIQFMKQISRLHLNSDVSIRLSQIGYWLNNGIVEKNLESIAEAASSGGLTLWIESEPNIEVNEIEPIYRELRQRYRIGMEIMANEANGRREFNGKDTIKLRQGIRHGSNSRESAQLYRHNMEMLMNRNVNLTLFERDAKRINRLMGLSKDHKKRLIFEFPLGYSSKVSKFQKSKLNLSVYVPYGKDWIPYFINRLAKGRVKSIAVALLNGEKTGVNQNAKSEKNS